MKVTCLTYYCYYFQMPSAKSNEQSWEPQGAEPWLGVQSMCERRSLFGKWDRSCALWLETEFCRSRGILMAETWDSGCCPGDAWTSYCNWRLGACKAMGLWLMGTGCRWRRFVILGLLVLPNWLWRYRSYHQAISINGGWLRACGWKQTWFIILKQHVWA